MEEGGGRAEFFSACTSEKKGEEKNGLKERTKVLLLLLPCLRLLANTTTALRMDKVRMMLFLKQASL